MHDRADDLGGGVALEGPLAGETLIEHAAKRPDVRSFVDGVALGLLGAHVGRRAEQGPGQGDIARESCGVGRQILDDHLGQPEVQDLDLAVGSDLDVVRLEIPVDDALDVSGLQGFSDLLTGVERLFDG